MPPDPGTEDAPILDTTSFRIYQLEKSEIRTQVYITDADGLVTLPTDPAFYVLPTIALLPVVTWIYSRRKR